MNRKDSLLQLWYSISPSFDGANPVRVTLPTPCMSFWGVYPSTGLSHLSVSPIEISKSGICVIQEKLTLILQCPYNSFLHFVSVPQSHTWFFVRGDRERLTIRQVRVINRWSSRMRTGSAGTRNRPNSRTGHRRWQSRSIGQSCINRLT